MNESGTLVKPKNHPWICPECGSKLRGTMSPPRRFCLKCDFEELPGERDTRGFREYVDESGKRRVRFVPEDHPDLEGYREGTLGGSPYAR